MLLATGWPSVTLPVTVTVKPSLSLSAVKLPLLMLIVVRFAERSTSVPGGNGGTAGTAGTPGTAGGSGAIGRGNTLTVRGSLAASPSASAVFASGSFSPFSVSLRPLRSTNTSTLPALKSLTCLTNALVPKPPLDSAAMGALPLFKTRWAADLLLAAIAAQYNEPTSAMLITAALKMTDPRLIPTLIALLDTVEGTGWAAPQINAQLAVLTKTAPDNAHDAAYWRGWWNQHIAELPEDVRRMPFPRLSMDADAAKAFSIRQDARYIEIGKDRNRAYWRVMSGRIIALPTRPLPVSASDTSPFSAIPVNDRPGLLICFLPEGGRVAAFRDFWWHLDQRAFEGKYYIALIAPPVESDKKTIWPLHADEKDKDRPTAQSRVRDVVRDMLAQAPINPARIFVLGLGDGGMAATACALDKSTPAHGFILIDAPFRSAELPPLGTIRGRKVVLLHNKRDHTLPEFVLTAAQKTLLQNGAALTRTDFDAAIGKDPLTVPFETLGAAVAALESAR